MSPLLDNIEPLSGEDSNSTTEENISSVICTWKDDKPAAISLTYDDGMSSHVEFAAPLMHDRGLNGTFFITLKHMGKPFGAEWWDWNNVSLMGHEVTSHTINHPDLTILDPLALWEEVVQSKIYIQENITTASSETFCCPYGYYNDEVIDLVKQHYIGARAAHNGSPSPVNSSPSDLYTVTPVKFGTDETVTEMNQLVEDAVVMRGWLIEMIHAIEDGGYEPVSLSDFTAHLDYLVERDDALWVAPFVNVVKYIKERDDTEVVITLHSDYNFTLFLNSSLDPDIYNENLTLNITLPLDWTDVQVRIGDVSQIINPWIAGEYRYFLVDSPINETVTITRTAPIQIFIEADPVVVDTGDIVNINGTVSSYPSSSIVQYYFDFGDGTNSNWIGSPATTHTYYDDGQYDIRLKVRDYNGTESNWSESLTITVNNQPPVAYLSAEPTIASIGDTVKLNGITSIDQDGSITHFYFDFGDGTNTGWIQSEKTTHSYSEEGNYDIKLKVRDDDGAESGWSSSIVITVNNQAPAASILVDLTMVDKGDIVNINGSSSFDPDGSVIGYYFDFGDGTFSNWIATATITHMYTDNGSYNIRLKVRDDDGAESGWSSSIVITVKSQTPTASISVNLRTVDTGDIININGSSSSDPDGSVVGYYFDFGDGTNSSWITTPVITHRYTDDGIYGISLKVVDNDGTESNWTSCVDIEVNNRPPIASLSSDSTKVYTNKYIKFKGGVSSDTDGVLEQFYFDFGDGTYSGWITSKTIMHNYIDDGNYNVELKVKDDDGAESEWSDSLTITVNNWAPRALLLANPTIVNSGDTVNLNGNLSFDLDGTITEYYFDFGNGTHSDWITATAIDQVFVDKGTYHVKVKVKDDDGYESHWSPSVLLTVKNSSPTASISVNPTTSNIGFIFNFDGSISFDPDGSVVLYYFDYGDGSSSGWISTPTTTHSYSDNGSYNIKLKVMDDDGYESDWTSEIVVNVPATEIDEVDHDHGPQLSPMITVFIIELIIILILVLLLIRRKKEENKDIPIEEIPESDTVEVPFEEGTEPRSEEPVKAKIDEETIIEK